MTLQKIALEEHFLVPGLKSYWLRTMEDVPAEARKRIYLKLVDVGEARLREMDEASIQTTVLSIAGPGVQMEPNAATAQKLSTEANDHLAETMDGHPTRFAGFAHLALQDGRWAAKELERCVREFRFCGALINGHSNGEYLDNEKFLPLWERAEELRVPIYLHPADSVSPLAVLEGHNGLRRATWEWTVETASHALRIIFSGLLDRFPNTTVILGHLGETLPYLLARIDSRARLYGVKLKRAPSEYFRRNFLVTTSGMITREPLVCALETIGPERVLFSADYPFESMKESSDFIENVAIDDSVRLDICARNAQARLNLKSFNAHDVSLCSSDEAVHRPDKVGDRRC